MKKIRMDNSPIPPLTDADKVRKTACPVCGQYAGSQCLDLEKYIECGDLIPRSEPHRSRVLKALEVYSETTT